MTNAAATVKFLSAQVAQDAAESAPVVSLDVALVVVGEMHLSADQAVNRLAAIQEQERVIKKEKEPLREGLEHALRRAGLETFSSPEGHSATLYSQKRESIDEDYLKSVLTPEQYARAFKVKSVQGMRIR